jgi:carboxyl-terminal processing protease
MISLLMNSNDLPISFTKHARKESDMSSSPLLLFLLDVACKGTVLLVLAFCIVRWPLRRASAGSRHLLWAATLFGLLILPVLSMMPGWQISLSPVPGWNEGRAEQAGFIAFLPDAPAKREPRPKPVQEEEDKAVLLAGRVVELPAQPAFVKQPPETETPSMLTPIAWWVVMVWSGGVVLSLAWLLSGWLSLWRLARKCRCLRDGPLTQMLSELTSELGIRRKVFLLMTSERAIPMTWGVWCPVVLLPEDAQNWTAERLRMILTHELAHIQRCDCLMQMLAHLVRGLYWFHPLAWLAVRQLRREQEHACDDLVLARGANPPDYAEQLLGVTTGFSPRFWTAPVALGAGRKEALRCRLVHLLDAERNHRPVPRRAFLLTMGLVLVLTVCLATLEFTLSPLDAQTLPNTVQQKAGDKNPPLDAKLKEVQEKLSKHYVAPVDEKLLVESALKGMLQGLKDPNADYLSADDLGRFDNLTKGVLIGIGVQLRMVDGRLTVITPIDGSPALKAGVRPGDLIEAIDGKTTRGLTINEAVQRMMGTSGSAVKLKVVRPEGVVEEITVTRTEIPYRSVNGFQRGQKDEWQFLLDDDRKIGYLHIQQFSMRTPNEVQETITALQKQGMKGLILDLRFCPGGLLEQAIEVCRLFVDKGVILTARGAGKEEKIWKATGKATLGDFPLLILINENTASAAEIVSGSLRDHDRAVLLGTRTYGKGSVQGVMKLETGGALKITTAYHYLPSGRNIQKRHGEKSWGVDPTDGYYVPLTAQQTEALQINITQRSLLGLKKDEQPKAHRLTPKIIETLYADPQLAAALRSMVARLTGGEFLKVGKDNGFMVEQLQRLEELRQRREQLQQSLQQVDNDITNVQQTVGKDNPREK